MKKFLLIILAMAMFIGCTDGVIPGIGSPQIERLSDPPSTSSPLIPTPVISASVECTSIDFYITPCVDVERPREMFNVPSFFLTWDESDINASYRVYINGKRVVSYLWGLSWHFYSSLYKEGTYRIVVRAVSNGVESADSNDFIIHLSKPPAPQNLRIVEMDRGHTLSWDEVLGTIYYFIYEEGDLITSSESNEVFSTYHFDEGKSYVVRSYNGIYYSDDSVAITVPE